MVSKGAVREQIGGLEDTLDEMESREHASFSFSKVSVKVAIDTLRWVVGDGERYYGEDGSTPAAARSPFEGWDVRVIDDAWLSVENPEEAVGAEMTVNAATNHEAKELALARLDDDVPYSALRASPSGGDG